MKRKGRLLWLLAATLGMNLSGCGPPHAAGDQRAAEKDSGPGAVVQALSGPAPELSAVSPNMGSGAGGSVGVIGGSLR